MYEKELFDETLDINSTNNYEISIQVSLNGFSFSLLDRLRNRFVMLRDYKLNGRENEICSQVQGIINQDDFLGKPYSKYRLIFSFEKSTLIPVSLYDPAVKDDYFKLNHQLEDGYIVSNNKISDPDSYILFDVRKDLFDLVCKAFPEASLSHQVRPLLNAGFAVANRSGDRYIHTNIEDTYFNIFIIKDAKLDFFNTFRYRNDSDILYFLLYCFEQLGVGTNEILHLTGQISRFDDLYGSLKKYVKNIKFEDPKGSFSMSYIFDEIETHHYCNLFNIINCA